MNFDTLSLYDKDRALVKELGLKSWDGLPCNMLHAVGTVKVSEGGSVRVMVNGMPALFFEFIITDREGGFKYRATTGSGSLSDFWPIAKALAENMFVIKNHDRLPPEECL